MTTGPGGGPSRPDRPAPRRVATVGPMTTTAITGTGTGFGGAIVAGHAEKDPDVLAQKLWDLHTERDTFRVQVSTD